MTKYVLSTATCGQKFVQYQPAVSPGGLNVPLRHVIIHGGANSASTTSGFGELTNTEDGIPLWTPAGVVTKVSDEDAALLEGNEAFCRARDLGFFQIMDTNPGDSHNKIKKLAAEMTPRDVSAPLTSETLKGAVKVTTKLKEDE